MTCLVALLPIQSLQSTSVKRSPEVARGNFTDARHVALLLFGIPVALRQHAYSPIVRDATPGVATDWLQVAVVAVILAAAITANVLATTLPGDLPQHFPLLGMAVWAAILLCAPLRKPAWILLPAASWPATFGPRLP